MKKFCAPFVLLLFSIAGGNVNADLTTLLDFGSAAGTFSFPSGDLTNAATSGANLNASYSFDIFAGDSTGTVTNGTDGINDITFDFQIKTGFDPYGGGVLDSSKGVTHDQQQSSSGLRGFTPVNQSGSNNSSTGDTHGYCVTVTFGDHLAICAEDLTALMTSVNTAGEVFESTSVVFNDSSGNPFGTANYEGFWDGDPMGSNGGNNTSMINANPWMTSGTGVYIAANTGVTDVTDSANPVAGTSAGTDNFDPNAAVDGGLGPAVRVSGFTWTTYLEDIATTANDDDITSSFTTFTSTLNGVDVTIKENAPVPEPGSLAILCVSGLGLLIRRRR